MMGFLLLLSICSFLGFVYFITRNSLLNTNQLIGEAGQQLEENIESRTALTAKLINSFSDYLINDIVIFNKITNSYNDLSDNVIPVLKDKVVVDNNLGIALKSISSIYISHPEFKQDKQFSLILNELLVIDKKITSSRELYNQIIELYNEKIESIPSCFIASIHNYKKHELIKLPDIENVDAIQSKMKLYE